MEQNKTLFASNKVFFFFRFFFFFFLQQLYLTLKLKIRTDSSKKGNAGTK